MYSKAGRASTEMFTALQNSGDFLEPKVKLARSPKTLHMSKKDDKLADLVAKRFGQNGLLKDLAGVIEVETPAHKDEHSNKSPNKSKSEMKKLEPFSYILPRDVREKALSPKKVSSSAAYYQPKYDWVEKRNLNVVDYSKSTTRRLFDGLLAAEEVKSATTNINTERPAIPDKPSSKIKGPISFDRQAGRPDILDEILKKRAGHSDSLSSPGLPSILSSVPRLPAIKFSKFLPRQDLHIETSTEHCPTYSPNYEFVKKSLGRVGAELSKVSGRRGVEKSSYYTNEAVYDYDEYVTKNKSHIFPKVKCPSFDKMAPRDRVLPSMNSRLSDPTYSPRNDSLMAKSEVQGRFIPRSIETSMMSNVLYTRT